MPSQMNVLLRSDKNNPMATTRTTEHKLSRNDIVAAVAELIAEQGLETLTMRNIARHVGCSVGTLPHYFDGKDDIVIAALNWSNERIFSRLGGMPDSEIHMENLYPILSTSMPVDRLSDIEWRVRLCLWDYAVTNDEMRASVNLIADYAHELLTALISSLQKHGEIRKDLDCDSTALTLYHMCIGAGFNMLHRPFEKREQELQPLHLYIESLRA